MMSLILLIILVALGVWLGVRLVKARKEQG